MKSNLINFLLGISFILLMVVSCNKETFKEEVNTREQYVELDTLFREGNNYDFVDDDYINISDMLIFNSLFGANETNVSDLLVFNSDYGSIDTTDLYNEFLDSYIEPFFVVSSGALFDYEDGKEGVLQYTFSDEAPNNNASLMEECQLTCLNTFKYTLTDTDGSAIIFYGRRKGPQTEFSFSHYHIYKVIIP